MGPERTGTEYSVTANMYLRIVVRIQAYQQGGMTGRESFKTHRRSFESISGPRMTAETDINLGGLLNLMAAIVLVSWLGGWLLSLKKLSCPAPAIAMRVARPGAKAREGPHCSGKSMIHQCITRVSHPDVLAPGLPISGE